MYEKWLKKKTTTNNNAYKNYKRLFESVKEKSKKNYFNERLNKYQNNVKKTWHVIKEVIGNLKPVAHTLPKRIVINNVVINDKKTIAEHFNRYFVNVGPNLAASIPQTNKSFESFVSENEQVFNEAPLTDDELLKAFASLKSNKSPGLDDIFSNVIKFVVGALVRPIKHIFNLSLEKGIFPDNLKIARITPIFKSGNEEFVNNYRPISVLPCFSKVLERVMYNRLYTFLIENNILYDKQFGFQKENSTQHAILQLTNQILQSFEQNKFTIGVFIDLSKAFDTVDHNILLRKLSIYGIKDTNLKWFRSW